MTIIQKMSLTPTPWRVRAMTVGTYAVFGATPHKVGDDVDLVCTVGNPDDARLLAAAPELLRALIEITDSFRRNGDPTARELMDKGRAAIAKATASE